MARLLTKLGVRVNVADEKVDALLRTGNYKLPDDGQSPKTGHAGKNVADLRAEIERRNEGREDADKLPVDGKKADLVAVLDADDAKANGND